MKIASMPLDLLYRQYGYIAKNVAQRFYRMPEVAQAFEFEELVDEGFLGLVNAQKKFVDKGKPFGEYATYWVDNYIRKMVNSRNQIRLPKNLLDEYYKIIRAQNSLKLKGRDDSNAAVAAELRMPVHRVDYIVSTVLASNPASYDAGISAEDDSPNDCIYKNGSCIMTDAVSVEDSIIGKERDSAIERALDILLPREKQVVLMAFGFYSQPMPADEIAVKLGCAADDVVRDKTSAIVKLRNCSSLARLLA